MTQRKQPALTCLLLTGVISVCCFFAMDASAAYTDKTSGCIDEYGAKESAYSPPQHHLGYGYFCSGPGDTPGVGCNKLLSGPYQIKFPGSQAYQDSTIYTTYMESMRATCNSINPESGIVARFYLLPSGSTSPVQPQECTLDANGVEKCTTICKGICS